MPNTNIYKNLNHTEEEIDAVLSMMRKTFDEHLSNSNQPKVQLNQRNKRNILFLTVSEIRQLSPKEIEEEIIKLFKGLEVNNFCHSEQDSLIRTDTLYCFRREINLGERVETHKNLIEQKNVASTSELLLKFKFKHTPDCIVFTMSYHFPTKGKDEWIYLFGKI